MAKSGNHGDPVPNRERTWQAVLWFSGNGDGAETGYYLN
jgi:hypothetical protein